ncbi:hypothetical protein RB195_017560 [Necator americanus]|uniref:Uncharacterized protein n=1 Tax=Necator americanus TaxID=51031 RepID=A0ABR1C5S9_NECAM
MSYHGGDSPKHVSTSFLEQPQRAYRADWDRASSWLAGEPAMNSRNSSGVSSHPAPSIEDDGSKLLLEIEIVLKAKK